MIEFELNKNKIKTEKKNDTNGYILKHFSSYPSLNLTSLADRDIILLVIGWCLVKIGREINLFASRPIRSESRSSSGVRSSAK